MAESSDGETVNRVRLMKQSVFEDDVSEDEISSIIS